jgi:hypothetical protein
MDENLFSIEKTFPDIFSLFVFLFLQWRTAAEAWHNWVWRICAKFQCSFCWWKIWIVGHVSCKWFAKFSILFILYLKWRMNFCLQHGQCLHCCSWKPLNSVRGYSKYTERFPKVLVSTSLNAFFITYIH